MPHPRAGSRRRVAAILRHAVREIAIVLVAVLAVSICQWDDPTTLTHTLWQTAPAARAHAGTGEASFDDDHDDPVSTGIAYAALTHLAGGGSAVGSAPPESFTHAWTGLDLASYGFAFLRESARRN
jgi:hypothetical protein